MKTLLKKAAGLVCCAALMLTASFSALTANALDNNIYLADPGIIGISSGTSFTAVIITAFFPTLYFFTPLFAFIGGVAVNAMFTGFMSAFNSGTGSNYSGAASLSCCRYNFNYKTIGDH